MQKKESLIPFFHWSLLMRNRNINLVCLSSRKVKPFFGTIITWSVSLSDYAYNYEYIKCSWSPRSKDHPTNYWIACSCPLHVQSYSAPCPFIHCKINWLMPIFSYVKGVPKKLFNVWSNIETLAIEWTDSMVRITMSLASHWYSFQI